MTGVGRASLGTVARGSHHRLAAERVDVEHRDPESRDVRRGPFHRVRDVVQLRIREHRSVRDDAAHRLRAMCPEQLEPHLQHADVRAQVRRQPLRLVEIGDIEGDHERVLRTRDHASTSSSSSTAPNPVGTLSRPRTSAGEASRLSFR